MQFLPVDLSFVVCFLGYFYCKKSFIRVFRFLLCFTVYLYVLSSIIITRMTIAVSLSLRPEVSLSSTQLAVWDSRHHQHWLTGDAVQIEAAGTLPLIFPSHVMRRRPLGFDDVMKDLYISHFHLGITGETNPLNPKVSAPRTRVAQAVPLTNGGHQSSPAPSPTVIWSWPSLHHPFYPHRQ